ncbi:hypothetical protein [Actinoplanes flavus]|uniref:hypothetical protein n=1 Tax=Actinoplanes flavus TaxID=2820290 RepID=UPI001EE5A944|nr:hypothetical protein [Actinoplanes flavus]
MSGLSVIVPGDGGDSILMNFERLASPVADSEEFVVSVSPHLVPWTAYQRDMAPAQVRVAPPEDDSEGVYRVRLKWRSSRSLPENWEVIPETRAVVAADLSREIRRALEEDRLPLPGRPPADRGQEPAPDTAARARAAPARRSSGRPSIWV